MAWTASVKSVDKQPSVILVTIEYSDGTNTVEETHKLYGQPDVDWLKRTAGLKIARLEGLAGTSVPTGPVGSWTDPTDPQYIAFLNALQKLERIKLLVDTKVLQETDQRVVDFIVFLRSKVDDYWDKL